MKSLFWNIKSREICQEIMGSGINVEYLGKVLTSLRKVQHILLMPIMEIRYVK